MATGDQNDIISRLKNLLPDGWFPDSSPVLTGILSGIASALSAAYGLIAYSKLQTRIATATDGFLDLISCDCFGTTLPRKAMETDAQFRARIRAELLLERGTRNGLIKALTLLTGRTPIVFEPADTGDAGSYNNGTMAYGAGMPCGSLQLPNQVFVTAYRPIGQGIPNIPGYGDGPGYYGGMPYITPSQEAGITDADIYGTIGRTLPLNAVAWTRINS